MVAWCVAGCGAKQAGSLASPILPEATARCNAVAFAVPTLTCNALGGLLLNTILAPMGRQWVVLALCW